MHTSELQAYDIQYQFQLAGGREVKFNLSLDPGNFQIQPGFKGELPHWTLLEFHKCRNCPLEPGTVARCPAAVSMAGIVECFDEVVACGRATVIATTCERRVSAETTIQGGISSLVGLLMATSGCPLTSFFKPMARFHLPFASTQETIWRATSTYLLAQYFTQQDGGQPDFVFDGLSRIYSDIQTVNISFAKRLRSACNNDSMVNAIILLDMFAQSMPSAIDESLEEIRPLFVPYLAHTDSR